MEKQILVLAGKLQGRNRSQHQHDWNKRTAVWNSLTYSNSRGKLKGILLCQLVTVPPS